VSRNPETPMRRIRENRTCDLPGPGDSHCTDHPAHDWSCYDARGDVSFNVRQGWTHRHPGCPDDGHVTADIGPVVKAVEQASGCESIYGFCGQVTRAEVVALCNALLNDQEDGPVSRRFLTLTLEWGKDEPTTDDGPPVDAAPARIETGDTLPTMPEMHIGFRPEESP
jgi:hypothetical protein